MTAIRWTEAIEDETEIAVADRGTMLRVRYDVISGDFDYELRRNDALVAFGHADTMDAAKAAAELAFEEFSAELQ
jgi:hypothetical protein